MYMENFPIIDIDKSISARGFSFDNHFILYQQFESPL